jgi:P27 family predicted phage terminase small subunit
VAAAKDFFPGFWRKRWQMGGKGSGGRNRKPTAIKKVQGNAGHRRLNKKEPKVQPGEPEMPAYLPTQARAEWKRLVPLLLEMKVLSRSDGAALGLICLSLAQVIKSNAAIEKYGMVCATLDQLTGVAVLKANPAVKILSDAMRRSQTGFASFGLDPASRSKLIAGSSKGDDDPLDDFLNDEDAEGKEIVH